MAHGRNGLPMSARNWLIAGLLATVVAMPAAAQQSNPPDDTRGRVATTIDGDAGLWWLPVADTNGKKMTRGSVERNSRNTPQGLMNVATFTANVSYGFTERLDVYAGWDFITRVDRDNQVLYVPTDQERGGVDTQSALRARALDRQQGRRPSRRHEVRVPERRRRAIRSASPAAPPSTFRPATPTQGAGQGSIAADLSARDQPVGYQQGRVDAARPATTSARTRRTPSSCTCRTTSIGARASASTRRPRG